MADHDADHVGRAGDGDRLTDALLAEMGHDVSGSDLRERPVLDRLRTRSGAELIVAGGYGHSRLRERMLGGATRDLLRTATLPVFFAH